MTPKHAGVLFVGVMNEQFNFNLFRNWILWWNS